MTKLPPTCRAPGCKALLGPDNRSGVCRKHTHSRWCDCIQCERSKGPLSSRPEYEPEAPPEPKTTRTVGVPYHASNSGVARKAPVTLPLAPWER